MGVIQHRFKNWQRVACLHGASWLVLSIFNQLAGSLAHALEYFAKLFMPSIMNFFKNLFSIIMLSIFIQCRLQPRRRSYPHGGMVYIIMGFVGNAGVWREIFQFEGEFYILYIKTHLYNKLWENWPASREINIFLALHVAITEWTIVAESAGEYIPTFW